MSLTREQLNAMRARAKTLAAAASREILVCAGTGCIAGGSLKIYEYLKEQCEKHGLKTRVALRAEDGEEVTPETVHFKKSG